MELTADQVTRWWAKVDQRGPDECWPWLASHWRGGYGQFRLGPRTINAHRVSFIIHFGQIPDGLDVLHRCDHPWCVNPRCLYAGNDAENVRDRSVRGRGARGERHHKAKLTEDDVRAIRAAYAVGGVSQQRLADLFKVNQTIISGIVRRVYWRHV